ncbi:MAG TPA: alpha/beta hydrolase [Acidobacteriota bacterium]|nr:alpha/beta hydrolase [Acidobacteriota bacterium]
MAFSGGIRKWVWAGALLAVCILFANPLRHVIFAVRVGLSLQKLASGAEVQNPDVREATVSRRVGARSYEALTYRPAKSPAKTAIIIVAGLSELGCYHPRLVALSKVLADNGMFVITPDIREFRQFQITAEPIEQIVLWYKEASKLAGGEKIQRTGIAGVSFSATLALMAAAKPEIRNDVGFFIGIGPYSNLARCTRGWFAADPAAVPKNYYPTRFYAKWIIMRAALDMVPAEKDRIFLRGVIDALLLQKEIPPADPSLTPEGVRWYAMAIMKENQTDAELAAEIERYLTIRIYPQLNPADAVSHLRCPAFFIHGAYDDLIPPEESAELHKRISQSYLLISPFLTHTHPTDKQLSLGQKTRAALNMAVFCYHLSRAIQ